MASLTTEYCDRMMQERADRSTLAMLSAFIVELAICALQIGTSVLLLVVFIFPVFAVTGCISYAPDDWHRTLAALMTFGFAVYAATRIGLRYGSLKHPLPPLWFVSLVLIALGMIGLWTLVVLDAFDFPIRLLSPLSDYWLPSDFPGDGFVTWSALAARCFAACAVLIAFGRLTLNISTKQIPASAHRTSTES